VSSGRTVTARGHVLGRSSTSRTPGLVRPRLETSDVYLLPCDERFLQVDTGYGRRYPDDRGD